MTTPSKVTSPSNIPEVQQLRDTIQLMDNFSQKGFSQIASIASLALKSLKVPGAAHVPDDIAYALEAICEKAEYVEGCINAEAESFGCNYIDENERLRWAARDACQKEV